jgi:branched-chain amino acid transport system substrate-binding protein
MHTKTLATALGLLCLATPALSQQISIKFGVLNDRSGLYADLAGEGSVVAARMAIEDFKAADKGIKAEVISADHQNKPDVGATIARRWYDQEGVDVILDVPTSSVALAVISLPARRTRSTSIPAQAPQISRVPPACPTRSTGPTTPGLSPTVPALPW